MEDGFHNRFNSVNYFDYANVNVLVLGGASGLGYEISKGFLQAGANVLIASRNASNLEKSCDELISFKKPNASLDWFAADLTDGNSHVELIQCLEGSYGGVVDVLVNSAGTNIRSKLSETDRGDCISVLETNLLGPMFFLKLALPLIKKSSRGRVINLASIFATVSYPERSNYAISKGGLLQLTRTLAAEWAKYNITVNSISPGPFLTELNRKVLDDPENYEAFCRNMPMRRFGNPEEIITTALYLGSAYSSYVTGSNILVDGGWTAT